MWEGESYIRRPCPYIRVRAGPERVAVPALLATGRVHHHLVATQARTRAGLLVETAEAREVHHFCTLVGYGADAVCPWLAFEALGALRADGKLAAGESDDSLAAKYIKARASSNHEDRASVACWQCPADERGFKEQRVTVMRWAERLWYCQ